MILWLGFLVFTHAARGQLLVWKLFYIFLSKFPTLPYILGPP